jgi:hypothetical protein
LVERLIRNQKVAGSNPAIGFSFQRFVRTLSNVSDGQKPFLEKGVAPLAVSGHPKAFNNFLLIKVLCLSYRFTGLTGNKSKKQTLNN